MLEKMKLDLYKIQVVLPRNCQPNLLSQQLVTWTSASYIAYIFWSISVVTHKTLKLCQNMTFIWVDRALITEYPEASGQQKCAANF